ncbi:hypothetical protein S7335_4975 [Synechococcus sp. PCC 7335]|uniref:DUF2301 domain-containing membrane protein n=1 Tax=Synechococcus sp. (strain ATCC 29403 / PCC 7335) TaxID=91464 RepID=UPI00017EC72D|nr:DUF2301 domain-containing membrane protein [Synechococcus sp. PCC 7335]EDX87267.1 hypothetical protein S7335_4975 [Synechococcus sp. PCC 7335]
MTVQTLNDVYEGQFGSFTIEQSDRQEVILYRAGLAVAAGSLLIATICCFLAPTVLGTVATLCYVLLWAALGLSLFKIHIYLRLLHRVLQAFWLIGGLASIAIALLYPTPLALTAYQFPLTIFGIGFTFAALTGIFFKEAFCFNRLETKFLVFLVPGLLLGHMVGVLSTASEQGMLVAIAVLFVIFAVRKVIQPIPPDIGDKSVFEYLEQERQQSA